MTTNDEMRERANSAVEDLLLDIFMNRTHGKPEEFDVSLADMLVAFAESEVSRAVRECIEELAKMACEDCEGGVVPATRVENDYPERWYHVVEGDDVHAENVYICAADDIREHAHLLYQRDLASKGEES